VTDGFIWQEWELTTKQAQGLEVGSTVAENEIGNTLCAVVKRDGAKGNHDGALQKDPWSHRTTSAWGDRGRACDTSDGLRSLSVIILGRSCQRNTEQKGCSSEKEDRLANSSHSTIRKSKRQTFRVFCVNNIY
jgi:hypothetical protein